MKSRILEDEGTSVAGVFKDEQVQAEGGETLLRVNETEQILDSGQVQSEGRDISVRALEIEEILDGGQTQAEEETCNPRQAPQFLKGTPTLGTYISARASKTSQNLEEQGPSSTVLLVQLDIGAKKPF